MTHPLLQDLNDAQRQGVLTTEGAVLMLAGAGSGKTKTLTHRIAYLVEEKKVHPSNILAVTFTNKAATEMRARINGLLGRAADDRSYLPFLGTFHSIAVRILRREAMRLGYPASFVIYDEADAQAVVKLVCKDLGIEEKVFSPQAMRGLISGAKNELIGPGEYAKLAQGQAQTTAALIYPEYQKRLRENGALDFDDIIGQVVRLLETESDIAVRYQQQFRHILVDEYQDTNHAQYRMIALLAQGHKNICVVGDDWQCLPAGSRVETSEGYRAIEAVKRGQLIRAAAGHGQTDFFQANSVKRFKYNDELINVTTQSGKVLSMTPNHVVFIGSHHPHDRNDRLSVVLFESHPTSTALLTQKQYAFVQAGQLYLGMLLPTQNDKGELIDDPIIKVERRDYSGYVYDLDIDRVHNYIAEGVAVHNSIYSWRGANYENILNFETDYPDAKVIKLEQNYRSTQHILDAAHSVITKNTIRTNKHLFTEKGHGEKLIIQQVSDELAEGQFIIQTIDRLVAEQGYKYADCAVLYRTNAQSRSLEESFLRYNTPYQIVGGLRFYERKEIKDTLAYLRFIANPQDSVSWRRVVNVPVRGLGDKSLAVMTDYAAVQGRDLLVACGQAEDIPGLTPKARRAFQDFAILINDFRESAERLPVAELVELVLKKTGYLQALDDGSLTATDRVENVQEFLGVAKGFGTTSLEEFLSDISLVTDLDGWENENNSVTLMTLHAAKGLEFKVVFMVGMEEGIFPHSRTIFEPAELEEERRLCYVGMTRARERLYLTHATARLLYGSTQHNPMSRFIMEIPAEYCETGLVTGAVRLGQREHPAAQSRAATSSHRSDPFPDDDFASPDLNVGDKVEHTSFGIGTVIAIEEDDAQVLFAKAGIKRLNIAFAPLRKL